MNFTHAITRRPANTYTQAITSSDLGPPDIELANQQHTQYCQALQFAGLQLEILPALEAFPDSVFVEDTAIVEPEFAVLSRPGAHSRRDENQEILPTLEKNFELIHRIEADGTLDGGDVCKVNDVYYLGISERTNPTGAKQLADILARYGYFTKMIDIRGMGGILHLKSAVNYLGEDTLLLDKRMADHTEFKDYKHLVIPIEEAYAANCLRINGVVLVPAGFPRTLAIIKQAGFETRLLDSSEYRKMDGGLSCLSLRW
jgi:dimethylargininase